MREILFISMDQLFLSLGSNLGDRLLNLKEAISRLKAGFGPLQAASFVYETEPWGMAGSGHTRLSGEQPAFLNQVISFDYPEGKEPLDVLENILNIEYILGRTRHERWGARTIDIDILLIGNRMIDTAGPLLTPDAREHRLLVPHPRLHLRNFVLIPLKEIAPGLVHPLSGKTIAQLLQECPDKLEVKRL